ncbi:BUD13 homolog [Dromiciops gliroides]|uniref:BUD13 homolog n=1 Tax=Dromiciops gliroides TaxID=33562 RepID=UPI001CC725E4|nr:BUD13 homolog [Dromiciops gliroides]
MERKRMIIWPLYLSPPRRARQDFPDSSPPRRTRHDSPDPLPPRRTQHDSPDSSTLRREPGKHLHDARDSTPQHRKFQTNFSTKKHQRHDVDSSLPGKRKQRASGSDLSPPRNKRKRDSGSDLSPPRRKQKTKSSDSDCSPPQRSQRPGAKATQMSPGAQTGWVSAVRRERQELRRQDQETKQLAAEFQNAETLFRDKSGRKRDLKLIRLEQGRKEEEEAEKKEQYAQWGKGLAQSRQQQQNVEDAIKEMRKPLARSISDEDLDQMLREQQREGDPMANFIKKKEAKENKDKKEKPLYNGPAAPLNRFNIRPGYRWDGMDRSNGFEEKHFARLAAKKAVEEIAYKWSIEDMQPL